MTEMSETVLFIHTAAQGNLLLRNTRPAKRTGKNPVRKQHGRTRKFVASGHVAGETNRKESCSKTTRPHKEICCFRASGRRNEQERILFEKLQIYILETFMNTMIV